MKRKIFLVLVIMTMLFSLHAYAEENSAVLKIITPSETIKAGETFEVAVELSNNPGICAIQFVLSYDSALMKCDDVITDEILTGVLSATNAQAQDGAAIAAASLKTIEGDGIVALYSFTANKDITNFEFELKNIVLADENNADVEYTVAGSMISEDVPSVPEDETDIEIETNPPVLDDTTDVENEIIDELQDIIEEDVFQENTGEDNTDSYLPSYSEDITAGESEKTEPTQNPESDNTDKEEIVEHIFPDVIGHWSESFVNQAVKLGLFKGGTDGNFNPNDNITRAQFITVLWRMSGTPEAEFETSFLDISEQPLEFKTAILWGQNNGYINGISTTEFNPNGTLTREAAMKILYYYTGGQSGNEILLTAIYDDAFIDSKDISDWAKPCMYWGVYNKLISGISETELSPKGIVTRAQLAKILVDYYNSFVK